MWSDTPASGARPDALGLDLDELMAMKPSRSVEPPAPGQRFPGGERKGKMRAQGSEFETISPFLPGDDIRHIDWRATARSGRAQVRRFAAAAHRARCIAVDLRPDLYFGSQIQLMSKTSALAAARLSWEAVLLNEPVGPAIGVEPELLRPRSGKRHVQHLLARLWRRYHDVGAGDAAMPPTVL